MKLGGLGLAIPLLICFNQRSSKVWVPWELPRRSQGGFDDYQDTVLEGRGSAKMPLFENCLEDCVGVLRTCTRMTTTRFTSMILPSGCVGSSGYIALKVTAR